MIKFLSVDDHPLLREGIAALVNAIRHEVGRGPQRAGRYRNVPIAPAGCNADGFQIPALNGIEAIIGIPSEFPNARVVVLTTAQFNYIQLDIANKRRFFRVLLREDGGSTVARMGSYRRLQLRVMLENRELGLAAKYHPEYPLSGEISMESGVRMKPAPGRRLGARISDGVFNSLGLSH